MTVTAKDRVMIFGPKADGTYVLSSRRQRGDSVFKLSHETCLMGAVSWAPSHEATGGSAEIKGSTPGKGSCVNLNLEFSCFSQGLSWRASTLKSLDAARWLLPCRGHV